MTKPACIGPELADFLESGVSVLVGTRDARFVGEALRGVGVRVHAGGAELIVFVPEATGERTVANLRDNGRVALCVSRIADHVTIQVKGRVLSIDAAAEDDREVIDKYRRSLADKLDFVGLPKRLGLRIAHWPSFAVRFAVEDVFLATPGPDAGTPLGARSFAGGCA